MSRVYFHSETGTAELRGSERAHCNVTCAGIGWAVLGIHFHDDPVLRLITRPSPLPDVRFLETSFRVSEMTFALPDGRSEEAWIVALNTCIDVGNDALRLMARLHGQCEVHAYIEGRNRAWLAEVIEAGRATNLLRPDQGWEGVTALLRQSTDSPIVLSYSVCHQFPNPHIAGWKDDEDGDGFYRLPVSEQWALAMKALRESGSGLEWRPDNWATQGLGTGMSAMTVREAATQPASEPADGERQEP